MDLIMAHKEFAETSISPAKDVHHTLIASNSSGASFCAPVTLLGDRLRACRRQQGLSIRLLAEKCGLSANTLSLIENNRTSPSVHTLELLARGLQVPIVSFFDADEAAHHVVYQQHGARPQVRFANGTLEMLGEGLPPLGAEPIVVTLDTTPQETQELSHAGREFIYCLEGRVTCTIDGQAYPLLPGDSLLFEAHAPHSWLNDQPEPSKLLVLFCAMEAHEKPAERHMDG
jgi:transcriptional regulator with XRE-family HTH domain